MQRPGFRLGRLVAQGGFAGEGVVPPALQLPKFRGKVTCPTYNLNGDPGSALAALGHPGIATRRFVAKNVCHGVVYDHDLHARVTALTEASLSHRLIWQGMEEYLAKSRRPPAPRGRLGTRMKRVAAPRGARAQVSPGDISRGRADKLTSHCDIEVMYPAPANRGLPRDPPSPSRPRPADRDHDARSRPQFAASERSH